MMLLLYCTTNDPLLAPSPPAPIGVEVRTPKADSRLQIHYMDIPWFHFQSLAQIECKYSYDPFQKHFILTTAVERIRRPTERILPTYFQPHEGGFWDIPDDDSHLDFFGGPSTVNFDEYHLPKFCNSATPHPIEFNSKALSICATLVDGSGYRSNTITPKDISANLSVLMIEQERGEVFENIKNLPYLSRLDRTIHLMRYVIYLCSNDLLGEQQLDAMLSWMIRNGDQEIIDSLIRIKSTTMESFLLKLLASAIRQENVAIVRGLIALRVDINIPSVSSIGSYSRMTYSRMTPLMLAVETGNTQLVRLLLDAGADPKFNGNWNAAGEALPLAMLWREDNRQRSNLHIIELLLAAGAEVSGAEIVARPKTTYSCGWRIPMTLLSFAAGNGDFEIVKYLLEAKAEVNATCPPSMTALQAAACANYLQIVQLLIKHKADVNAPTGPNYDCPDHDCRFSGALVSPIQFATYHNNFEMVEMLLKSGANVQGFESTEIEYQIWRGEQCYDTKPWKEHTGPEWHSPMQLATMRGDLSLVRYLRSVGASVNRVQIGKNPLQIAAEQDKLDVVQFLIEEGAYVNCPANLVSPMNLEYTSYKGTTALQAAAGTGKLDLLLLLLEAGAHTTHRLVAQAEPRFKQPPK